MLNVEAQAPWLSGARVNRLDLDRCGRITLISSPRPPKTFQSVQVWWFSLCKQQADTGLESEESAGSSQMLASRSLHGNVTFFWPRWCHACVLWSSVMITSRHVRVCLAMAEREKWEGRVAKWIHQLQWFNLNQIKWRDIWQGIVCEVILKLLS